MSNSVLETFSVTGHATDPRADGASRVVRVSATQVVIERVLQNVRMRIVVPVAAYRKLVLAVRLPSGNATLMLRHDDGDLDVALGSGEAVEIAHKAKAWGRLLGQPVVIAEAYVTMGAPIGRRTKRAEPSRRSRFARRRKLGALSRLDMCFSGEDEIIART